jgi:hypothetical protein
LRRVINMQRKKQKQADIFQSFGIARPGTHGQQGAAPQPTSAVAADDLVVLSASDNEQQPVEQRRASACHTAAPRRANADCVPDASGSYISVAMLKQVSDSNSLLGGGLLASGILQAM